MSWWNIYEADVYTKDEIVKRCKDYIASNRFKGNVAEKRQKIAMIERKASRNLAFRPIGAGWGKSPMNHNCWISTDDESPEGENPSKNKSTNQVSVERTGGKQLESKLPERDYSVQPMINKRPWGGGYRAEVLALWGKCAMTGCQNRKLLTASHILPVNQCNTEDEMQDPYNCIALTPTFDKLFDSGYISFKDDGGVMITSKLAKQDCQAINLHAGMKIDLPAQSLKYMSYHREHIFRK